MRQLLSRETNATRKRIGVLVRSNIPTLAGRVLQQDQEEESRETVRNLRATSVL